MYWFCFIIKSNTDCLVYKTDFPCRVTTNTTAQVSKNMVQSWWILTEGRLEPFNGTNNFKQKLTANYLYFLDGKLVCYMFLLLQFHHTTGSDFPLNGGYSFHFCWENFLFLGMLLFHKMISIFSYVTDCIIQFLKTERKYNY